MDSKMAAQTSVRTFAMLILLAFVASSAIAATQFNRNNQNPWVNPIGLWRSQSDPTVNRNHFHRQSAFSRRDHCKNNYKFDYVQLTLQWAPGTCSTSPHECKREEAKHFTVHGMWPTIRGTQEPADCCFDNNFDFRALQPILPALNEYWFSYYEPGDNGNRGFWAHEWLKHGTCARDVASLRGEVKYFGTTVNMVKQMAILETLKKANIVPVNGKAYRSADIVSALAPISQGKVIQIDCDFEHDQPIPLLKGLHFCFDADLKPSDCPEMKRKCNRQVIFPASATRISRSAYPF